MQETVPQRDGLRSAHKTDNLELTTAQLSPQHGVHFVQLAAQQRILRIFAREFRQQLFGPLRLLLAHVHDSQQDLGERAQVMAALRHDAQILDALLLAALHILEMLEPPDEEWQAAPRTR